MRDIHEVAAELGLEAQLVQLWGPGAAKLHLDALAAEPRGNYVLVTAMTPDRRGVGKTTVSLALGDALRLRGRRAVVAIRQSSAGPTFGAKGGGGGGGEARVVPLRRALLHLTGDMHAVTAAHNLVAALLDNAWHHGHIDLADADVAWNRAADVNDRFLRRVDVGYGKKRRDTQFELTSASELMAILALVDGRSQAEVVADLRARIGRVVLALTPEGPITADDVQAAGAATAILCDAVQPNLMQSAGGTPVLLHTGPFANIAHGCSSIVADRVGLGGAEWTITEAGFGAEVGAEKFFNIKCRRSGLWPNVAVLVATTSAIRDHGSLEDGLANLEAQIRNVQRFGVPVVVTLNAHPSDEPDVVDAARQTSLAAGAADFVVCDGYARGGPGALKLADAVMDSAGPHTPRLTYVDAMPVTQKLEKVASQLYGAASVRFTEEARRKLDAFDELGASSHPVCVAKTPYSLSADAQLRGAPQGHTVEVTDARWAAGAGYVYVLTTSVLTMPGMSVEPRALGVDVSAAGTVVGLE